MQETGFKDGKTKGYDRVLDLAQFSLHVSVGVHNAFPCAWHNFAKFIFVKSL